MKLARVLAVTAALAALFMPAGAFAAQQVLEYGAATAQLWNTPPLSGTNAFQTALKPRDQNIIIRALTRDQYASATFDLSALGAGTATASPGAVWIGSVAHSGYVTDPFTVGAVADGVKTIPVSFENTSTTTSLSVLVDGTPPTVDLSDFSFASETPDGQAKLLLSGRIDGTGSTPHVQSVSVKEDPVSGHTIPNNCKTASSVASDTLADALASSTDGTFTAVPLTVPDSYECFLEYAQVTVAVTVYDDAGNLASSTASFTLPRPTPPVFPEIHAPIIAMEHDAVMPYRLPIGFRALGDPKYFVATGTLETFVAPIARFHGVTGSELYSFALASSTSPTQLLDCKTPEKTADEWGIPHANDVTYGAWNGPYVVMGPFSGTQCEITAGAQVLVVPVRADFPREYLYSFVMGDNGMHENFAAYGPAAPPAPPAPPEPPTPKTDSVLFIPGTEASRLYYLDPSGLEFQVWDPNWSTDIPRLAMNPDGTSKYTIYTKDIIDTFFKNDPGIYAYVSAQMGADTLEVYSGFEAYMDSLVASSTLGMHEWRAFPYDWRYGVKSVAEDGTLVKQPHGSVKRVYLEDVIDQMASSSATGKVTIIAHSNGGLVAKAMLQKLAAEGKAGLVDKLILVGSPQWGTPSAIGALLHADNFAIFPWFIVNSATARSVMHDMQDAYDLLPSAAYFTHVLNPLTEFATSTSPAADYASAYGDTIHSSSVLNQFLEDTAALDAGVGNAKDLNAPQPLRSDLIDAAAADHSSLDAWTPPAGLSVTSIAGWGQMTASGYRYESAVKTICTKIDLFHKTCATVPTLRHTPIPTQDGDETVVTPSAVGNVADAYYFNAAGYSKFTQLKTVHQNLTSATSIQKLILSILNNENLSYTDEYLTSTRPTGGLNPLNVISTHSPVNLLVTDTSGNKSGVVAIPGTGFSGVVQNIPGSFVSVMDDEEYVYLPQSGTYQAVATGYGDGPAGVEVGTMAPDGTITTTQTFSALPVTSGTALSWSIDGATGKSSDLSIDEKGSGTTDATVAAIGGTAMFEPLQDPASEPTVPASASIVPQSSPGAISIPVMVTATSTETEPSSTPEELVPPALPVVVMGGSSSAASSNTRFLAASVGPSHVSVLHGEKSKRSSAEDKSSNISQTAAVVDALSQSGNPQGGTPVYHWVSSLWSTFTHFFARIL